MKKSIRLFLMVPTAALMIIAVCYLSFKAIEQSIIEENEEYLEAVQNSEMNGAYNAAVEDDTTNLIFSKTLRCIAINTPSIRRTFFG